MPFLYKACSLKNNTQTLLNLLDRLLNIITLFILSNAIIVLISGKITSQFKKLNLPNRKEKEVILTEIRLIC